MDETLELAKAIELLERCRVVITTQMPEWRKNLIALPVVGFVDSFVERMDENGAVRLEELNGEL